MAQPRPERAVIVAAGRSSRLYPRTLEQPKPLLEVGGEAMLRRSIRLMRQQGIDRIALVVGYRRRQIEAAVSDLDVDIIYNPFYAQTNNLGSLWFARDWVAGQSFIYSHADIVYAPELLERLLERGVSADAALLVDVGPADEEAMKVRVDEAGTFVASNKEIAAEQSLGEWVGLATFAESSVGPLFDAFEAVLENEDLNAYDTEAFTRMAAAATTFAIVATEGMPWVEVDFEADYQRAQELFGS